MKKHIGHWEGIMLHHTATKRIADIKSIKKSHLNRGFGDIGYHYLIRIVAGKVFIKKGRSTIYNGAHCDVGDYNSKYLGVALIGDFSKDTLSEIEYNLVANSIKHIMQKHNVNKFIAHRDVKPTQCPGNNIKMNEIKKYL